MQKKSVNLWTKVFLFRGAGSSKWVQKGTGGIWSILFFLCFIAIMPRRPCGCCLDRGCGYCAYCCEGEYASCCGTNQPGEELHQFSDDEEPETPTRTRTPYTICEGRIELIGTLERGYFVFSEAVNDLTHGTPPYHAYPTFVVTHPELLTTRERFERAHSMRSFVLVDTISETAIVVTKQRDAPHVPAPLFDGVSPVVFSTSECQDPPRGPRWMHLLPGNSSTFAILNAADKLREWFGAGSEVYLVANSDPWKVLFVPTLESVLSHGRTCPAAAHANE